MTPQTAAPAIIHKLVETFAQNLDAYRSSKNETELRVNFLNPFFTALGWDVVNEKGYDELGKEVTHEFSVEVAGQQKKADYAFRVGRGERFDFLVEAKKPSVKIEASGDAAFQIRRYGWSAKIPVNILTDFEHFAVYDCRTKPSYSDKASVGRIMLIHYTEYVERWNEIVEIFSPEAVRKGSFAKYAEGLKGKKGTADVDDAFLQEIERWREALAKNIALRNKTIDIAGLNYSVQMTIDRIVFLRICEERGIEPENQLQEICTPLPPIFAERGKALKTLNGENGGMSVGQGGGVYAELCNLFKRADTKYNSGLFHFKAEKGQNSRADDLTLSPDIDDKVLKDIISNLYYPKSPYAFLYIPSDILGQVYERFLGKVIRLTDGHQAKVEEKPEVRKAGGVYYTPTYIVDYIVKNTVGKLLEIRERRAVTPAEVAKLKIVDPACGSGTFLLGAYQFLLDWHLEWYTNNDPEKWVKANAITPSVPAFGGTHPPNTDWGSSVFGGGRVGAGHRLTTAKKKEILLNNIHGVDIDAQAVEVTKLSLLLKVLENASGQLGLGMERVLPDLGNNIKCGNSLIGFDYFEGQLFPDEEERQRVNPFDWKREFPDVFAKGGFDAVIGNPPYIRIQRIEHTDSDYLYRKYKSPTSKADISLVFMEKSLVILNDKGVAGLICTSQWLSTDYGKNLREMLSDGQLNAIINFGSLPVFETAQTYPAIFIISRKITNSLVYKKIESVEQLTLDAIESAPVINIELEKLGATPWKLGSFDIVESLNNKKRAWKALAEFGGAYIGALTGMDDAFVVTDENIQVEELETSLLLPYAYRAGDIEKFSIVAPRAKVIYPYKEGKGGSPELLTEENLRNSYPNIHRHLLKFKDELRKRMDSRKYYANGSDWFRYLRPGSYKYITPTKLIIKGIDTKTTVGILPKNSAFNGANCPGIILDNLIDYSSLYILGVLNSRIVSYYLRSVCPPKLGGYRRFNANNLNTIPIRAINFTDPAEKAQHDKMVSLVEQMLSSHKSLAMAQSPQQKERLERQIEVTDKAIDSLVYALYGLTEEEIRIVEGK